MTTRTSESASDLLVLAFSAESGISIERQQVIEGAIGRKLTISHAPFRPILLSVKFEDDQGHVIVLGSAIGKGVGRMKQASHQLLGVQA